MICLLIIVKWTYVSIRIECTNVLVTNRHTNDMYAFSHKPLNWPMADFTVLLAMTQSEISSNKWLGSELQMTVGSQKNPNSAMAAKELGCIDTYQPYVLCRSVIALPRCGWIFNDTFIVVRFQQSSEPIWKNYQDHYEMQSHKS